MGTKKQPYNKKIRLDVQKRGKKATDCSAFIEDLIAFSGAKLYKEFATKKEKTKRK